MTKEPIRFPGNYLVRTHFGARGRFAVIQPIASAPPDERLMAAILRNDGTAARQALGQINDPVLVDRLFMRGAAGNLVAMVYERVRELDLEPRLAPLLLSNGQPLLPSLRQQAMAAPAVAARLDRMLAQLHDWLSELAGNVVWLKGCVLARTLYPRAHLRLSLDIDLLVRPGAEVPVAERLIGSGFEPIWDNPGACHQTGVGPVGTIESLSIVPWTEFEFCHNLCLTRSGWPLIEFKCDPLERGLRMKELGRFFDDCRQLAWQDRTYTVPEIVDHLLLELTHLHKHGFSGWAWLYDIHLLCREVSRTPGAWAELLHRVQLEGVEASAWAALDLVRDRLGTPIPPVILEELEPRATGLLPRCLTFTTNPEFLWNSASLPQLWLSTCFLGDSARKRAALGRCLLPPGDFLSRYYLNGRPLSWWMYPVVLAVHWLVLALPGGLIRRTFGRLIWGRA
jgi:hypothetical protein